ncbi:hypothetical protein vBBcePLY3_00047 [Bacillus phage vB_BceP_LY3]|uniref:Uncharacterized protein n=1 Tax=Bacillus phage vB_BceP_LY3 TaxID=2950458 RepID=A0AAE9LVM4_9CAUD|nr:hypothetical protein vBBcePLY3_00047 [Bacillus phage vB_BceP_LY3]
MYNAKVKLKSGMITYLSFYSKQEIIEFENKGHEIIRIIKKD